jgi:CheY-like chemotaxis protein
MAPPAPPGARILCLLPRGVTAVRLSLLLKGYGLEASHAWPRAVTIARRHPCDLNLVQAPLDWADAVVICRKLRAIDPQTPLVVYSTSSSPGERREMLDAGVHAYLARSDDAQNLAGSVGQLIMLAELRSMEALATGAKGMRESIVSVRGNVSDEPSGAAAEERLKLEARRIFTEAGGSPANFERMWPAIYDGAIRSEPQGKT